MKFEEVNFEQIEDMLAVKAGQASDMEAGGWDDITNGLCVDGCHWSGYCWSGCSVGGVCNSGCGILGGCVNGCGSSQA